MSRRKQVKPRHFENENLLTQDHQQSQGETNIRKSILNMDEAPAIESKQSNEHTRMGDNTDTHEASLAYHRYLAYKKRHLYRYDQRSQTPQSQQYDMSDLVDNDHDNQEMIKSSSSLLDKGIKINNMEETNNLLNNLHNNEEQTRLPSLDKKNNDFNISGESGVAEDQSDFGSDISNPKDMANTIESATQKDNSDVLDKVPNATDDVEDDDELASLSPTQNSESNVKLETLKNTSVAVAQIVENNFPSADNVPSLMQTVYSLWQQQIMQCQMLEMLRQNLMKVSGVSSTAGHQQKFQEDAMLEDEGDLDIDPDMSQDDFEEERKGLENDYKHTFGETGVNAVNRVDDNFEPREKPYANDEPTNLGFQNPQVPRVPTKETVFHGLPRHDVTAPTSAVEAAILDSLPKGAKNKDVGTALDRSQYAADDPLFRHKCRFCYKVFGSDSALQIHVRSHTGEKPYVCDQCGSKFSTRGNLKVHYERHLYDTPLLRPTLPPAHPNKEDEPRIPLPYTQSRSPFASMSSLVEASAIATAKVFDNRVQNDNITTTKASKDFDELSEDKEKDTPIKDIEESKNDTNMVSKPSSEKMNSIAYKPNTPEKTKDYYDDEEPTLHKPMASSSSSSAANELAYHHARANLHMMTSPLAGHLPPVSLHNSGASPMMLSSPFGSPPFGMGGPMPPFGSPFVRPSILPRQDDEDSMEEFMEIDKSETCKLEAMVKNIETKLTDPNQCVLCKRILSCKSALQMHYRIHTGERPFKCKICGRAFTTKGNLKTHMSVHRIKPPMKALHHCMICQRQFTNVIVLQQHIQSHHPSELSRMFPSPFGPMPSPGSMGMLPMPFPGFPFPMSPGMQRFPFFPPGVDPRRPFSHLNHEDDDDNYDDVDENDFEKELDDDVAVNQPATEPKPEMSEGNQNKRVRDADDGDSIELDMGSEKRPKTDFETENTDSTDDEEVPRDVSIKEQAWSPNTDMRRGGSQGALNHNQDTDADQQASLKALEDRMRSLERKPQEVPHVDGNLKSPETYRREGSISDFSMKNLERQSFVDQRERGEISLMYGTHKLQASPTPFPFVDFPRNHPLEFAGFNSKSNTTCDVCFKTFACKSALDIHYRSHTKEKPFKCELCDRSFSTKGNMKQHMLSHNARELQSINFTMSSDDSSHDTQNSYSSPALPSAYPPINPFSKESLLKSPAQATKQSPDKPEDGYLPEIKRDPLVIQPEVNKPINPVQPLMREHDDPMFLKSQNLKHMCRVCHKPFSSSSALQIHMRTHTGERPFRCNVCAKAFTTRGNMKVHMSTHEDRSSTFCRRGRRMSLDGSPHFDSISSPFPSSSPFSIYPPPPPHHHHHPAHPPSSLASSLSSHASPLQPSLKSLGGAPHPDMFLSRFPPFIGPPSGFSAAAAAANAAAAMNGFMSRPNEIPVIQISPRVKVGSGLGGSHEKGNVSPNKDRVSEYKKDDNTAIRNRTPVTH